jgi:hypothetical protein
LGFQSGQQIRLESNRFRSPRREATTLEDYDIKDEDVLQVVDSGSFNVQVGLVPYQPDLFQNGLFFLFPFCTILTSALAFLEFTLPGDIQTVNALKTRIAEHVGVLPSAMNVHLKGGIPLKGTYLDAMSGSKLEVGSTFCFSVPHQ